MREPSPFQWTFGEPFLLSREAAQLSIDGQVFEGQLNVTVGESATSPYGQYFRPNELLPMDLGGRAGEIVSDTYKLSVLICGWHYPTEDYLPTGQVDLFVTQQQNLKLQKSLSYIAGALENLPPFGRKSRSLVPRRLPVRLRWGDWQISIGQAKKDYKYPELHRPRITHNFTAWRCDRKAFTCTEAISLIEKLGLILSLVFGGRPGPQHAIGILPSGEVAWSLMTPLRVDDFKHSSSSWAARIVDFVLPHLSTMFHRFSDETEREWLSTATNLYVDALRRDSGLQYGALIAQCGLELIGWETVVERGPRLDSDEWERRLSATSQLRILLDRAGVSTAVPPNLLNAMKSFFEKQARGKDGVSLAVEVRNCIAHPTSEKRKALAKLKPEELYDVYELLIYYLELLLLHSLKHKGPYQDRVFGNPAKTIFRQVPWAL